MSLYGSSVEGKGEMARHEDKKSALTEFGQSFHKDEKGATAIEYALIAALVFLAIVSSIHAFSSSTNNMYQYFTSIVNAAIS
jgi:Flp pilus assembly pilin Flp